MFCASCTSKRTPVPTLPGHPATSLRRICDKCYSVMLEGTWEFSGWITSWKQNDETGIKTFLCDFAVPVTRIRIGIVGKGRSCPYSFHSAYDWTDRFSATSVAIFRSYLFVVLVTQLSGTEVLMPEGFPIKLEAGIVINKWYIRRQRSAEIFIIQNQECPTTFFQIWSVDRHHQLPLDEHQY